jgi:branched-chain amino acid transport system ATP-binding protein
VLVLDEPSLGLAPKIVSEIFSVLSRLRSEAGLTILLVEQNARAALGVADRAYVMDRGSVVMSGQPRELLDDPRVQAAYLGGGYSADAESAS